MQERMEAEKISVPPAPPATQPSSSPTVESVVEKKVTVTLVLNEAAATWLKAYVQNPICEDESERDSTMRHLFWDALKDVELF